MFYLIKKKIYKHFGINITILLSAVFMVLGFAYLYFVNSTVAGIVGKDSGTKEYRELSVECQKLEKEYLNLVGEIDLNYARSMGMEEKKNVNFVSRQKNYALNQSLSANY